MLAAQAGDIEIVRILLEYGASPCLEVRHLKSSYQIIPFP